ncbi:hypothetical protein FHY52_30215 [Nocardia nova]|nr:hypothetical protein [Nocardia nova]
MVARRHRPTPRHRSRNRFGQSRFPPSARCRPRPPSRLPPHRRPPGQPAGAHPRNRRRHRRR